MARERAGPNLTLVPHPGIVGSGIAKLKLEIALRGSVAPSGWPSSAGCQCGAEPGKAKRFKWPADALSREVPRRMTSLFLDQVSKEFSGGVKAVTDLTLEVEQGELLVLVGPSGSGKTTVLRMIAGLEAVTSGTLRFDGVDVTSTPAWRRGTALVAESAALLPHATVADNLLWSRRQRTGSGWDRWWPWSGRRRSGNEPRNDESRGGEQIADSQGADERGVAERELKSLAQRMGLLDFLERRPHALSAGQQQRVALGRALLAQPRVLLLDEPLGRLDGTRRSDLARELKRIHRQSQTTWIYVTHDRLEAVAVADRIAVLEGGRLLQVGRPAELSVNPQHRLVATWETDGVLTTLEGRLWRSAGRLWFDSRWLSAPVAVAIKSGRLNAGRLNTGRSEGAAARPVGTLTARESPRAVDATWRPNQVTVELLGSAEPIPAGGEVVCRGVVEEIEERGEQVLVGVELIVVERSVPTSPTTTWDQETRPEGNERRSELTSGDTQAPQRRGRITGVGRPGPRLRPGDLVRVRFDWARARWFDSVSGQTMSVGEKDV